APYPVSPAVSAGATDGVLSGVATTTVAPASRSARRDGPAAPAAGRGGVAEDGGGDIGVTVRGSGPARPRSRGRSPPAGSLTCPRRSPGSAGPDRAARPGRAGSIRPRRTPAPRGQRRGG